MKNTVKTLMVLLILIAATGKQYAQGLPFIPVSCSKLTPKNMDREENIEIAEACREIWTSFKGVGLLGPFGRYVRHVYNGETVVVQNGFGAITGMNVYVTAIVRKKNGKFKVAYVRFFRQYMGGGQYGRLVDGFVSGDIRRTRYECVEKLPDWLGTGPVPKPKTKEEKAQEKSSGTGKPDQNKESK